MKRQPTPVSDRVRDAIPGDADPQLVREIEMLERIASAGVAHVAANGKWPHWPLDRWITVCGFVGMILGGVWFAGGRWKDVEHDIASLKASVAQLIATQQREQWERAADRAREWELNGINPRPDGPARSRRTLTFPRDERFVGQESPDQ